MRSKPSAIGVSPSASSLISVLFSSAIASLRADIWCLFKELAFPNHVPHVCMALAPLCLRLPPPLPTPPSPPLPLCVGLSVRVTLYCMCLSCALYTSSLLPPLSWAASPSNAQAPTHTPPCPDPFASFKGKQRFYDNLQNLALFVSQSEAKLISLQVIDRSPLVVESRQAAPGAALPLPLLP